MLDPLWNPTPRRSAGRRYVTVLFCDVIGSSEYAETLEAEDYAQVLERYRAFVRTVVARHGGVIARMQGDGALALFGHLETREDDGRRATEAAFELHAATAALRVGSAPDASPMRLHSGIHSGLVLVIEGDIERGRFDVVGEVPNTASRIVGLAATGEVLVSAETLGPHAHFFEMTSLGQLPIRGRSRPLEILRIEGRRQLTRRIDAAARRRTVAFAGRAGDMALLRAAAVDALDGPCEVAIVGEPGVGKTRLLGEFQREFLAQGRVLHGFCESYLASEPLQPFLHWGRAALGWRADAALDTNDAAIVASLDAFAGVLDAPTRAAARELTMGRAPSSVHASLALVSLIATLAAQSPLLLILDDWQWVDDATRIALAALRERQVPLLLVVASRPMDAAAEREFHDARFIRLQPLAAHEADTAISAWLPGVEPFVAQEIYRQSGGTPLLLEELCHAVASGNTPLTTPGPGGQAGHAGLAWLDGMVASRLARLDARHAACLQTASVLGNVFPVTQLAELVDDAASMIANLLQLDFLAPAAQPGLLKFKHVLTRDAVYATVDATRRRELHRQVANSLEIVAANDGTHEWREALAFHHEAAGHVAKAAEHAQAAGDQALAVMALDRARAHYLTALRSLDAMPSLTREAQLRWCGIAQKLGQTCVFDPLDVAQGLRLFARAAALAHQTSDANTIARAEYWLGYVNYGRGDPRSAVRHCESALAHAVASGDHRLTVQVQASLGQSLASAGRYERAMPLLHRAVESKRRQGHASRGQAVGSVYTLGRIGYTLGDQGRFAEAHACLDEALALLGEPLHAVGASVRELRCAVLLWEGRWAEAVRVGLEGADIAMRCRSRYLTAMGRALAACGQWVLDRDAAALKALREPIQWIEASGGAVSTSLIYGRLLEGCAELGLEAELRRHAVQLFARARADDRHGLPMGRRALARWFARRGEPSDRIELQMARADRGAVQRASPREAAENRLARADIARITGATAAVRPHAEAALAAFESLHMAWHADQARALLCGIDGSHDAAEWATASRLPFPSA